MYFTYLLTYLLITNNCIFLVYANHQQQKRLQLHMWRALREDVLYQRNYKV